MRWRTTAAMWATCAFVNALTVVTLADSTTGVVLGSASAVIAATGAVACMMGGDDR